MALDEHFDFLVRLDNLDVQIPRVLIFFLKIGMGAHKHPPKLGYGGSGCKIQYKSFEFHVISMDEMIIGAKTLIFAQGPYWRTSTGWSDLLRRDNDSYKLK